MISAGVTTSTAISWMNRSRWPPSPSCQDARSSRSYPVRMAKRSSSRPGRGWNPDSEVALIDFSGTFLRYLVNAVTAADFGGSYATFAEESNFPKFFAVFLARFQDDQGHHQGENLIVVRHEDDSIAVDGQFLSRLFDAPLRDADPIKRDPPDALAVCDRTEHH
jgi:hypothetical protein